jgi:hypothetical protein
LLVEGADLHLEGVDDGLLAHHRLVPPSRL